jgi:hypothetical protein
MGICSAVDCTAALQALVSCPFDHRRDKRLALSTVFDTDECPRAGEVLDQVELIAVPVSVSWRTVIVKTKKHGLHAQDQPAPENGGLYIQCGRQRVQQRFRARDPQLRHRSRRFRGRMVADCRRHETRIPAAERQRSRASPVSRNLASFEAHGVACVYDTPQSPPAPKLRGS